MAWCCNTPRPGTGNAQRERSRGRSCEASRRLLTTCRFPQKIMRTNRNIDLHYLIPFKKILTPDHIGKWEHSFSAFKTSRALKMTESSVPIQSSKKACLGLKLPCAQRPLVSQHRGKATGAPRGTSRQLQDLAALHSAARSGEGWGASRSGHCSPN